MGFEKEDNKENEKSEEQNKKDNGEREKRKRKKWRRRKKIRRKTRRTRQKIKDHTLFELFIQRDPTRKKSDFHFRSRGTLPRRKLGTRVSVLVLFSHGLLNH